MVAAVENSGGSSKSETQNSRMTQQFHSWGYPQSTVSRCADRLPCVNVGRDVIHESQEVKMTQMSLNRPMGTQPVAEPEHGSQNPEKEGPSGTCFTSDELQTLVMWKKPETKGHILWDSFYRTRPELARPQGQGAEQLPAAGGGGRSACH